MYPYDSYNTGGSGNNSIPADGGPQAEYTGAPLVPQQRQPDENGQYHFTPGPETRYYSGGNSEPPEKKRKSKAPRYIAAAAAIIVASSAAGGGTAFYILQNDRLAQEASAAPVGTVLQASAESGGSPAEQGSIAYVAQVAADSVVEIDIKTEVQNGYFFGPSLAEGSGSGVIIREDGYILTNNHVVEGTDSILVRLRDGTEYDATLIGTDSQTDLAVIKIEAAGLSAATFADSDNIQVGDMAVAIGNPLGELGGTVTSGIISATGREVSIDGGQMTLLQTSAAVNPGNSGGGLFDANGHLIGVVNAKSSGVEIEGLGFAIPSNTAQQVAADIIDKGYVSGRPIMGITVVEVNDQRTAMVYGVNKAGVYIVEPGDNEGFWQGDRFVFIDGKSIESTSDVTGALREHAVGDTVNVTVERDGRAVETQVTLQENIPEAAKPEQEPPRDPDAL